MLYRVIIFAVVVNSLLIISAFATGSPHFTPQESGTVYVNSDFNISSETYIANVRRGDCRLEDAAGQVLIMSNGEYTLLGVSALVQEIGIEGVGVMVEDGLGGDILSAYHLGYSDHMVFMANGSL